MTSIDKRVTWAEWATQFNIPRLRRAKSDRRYFGGNQSNSSPLKRRGPRKPSVHSNVYWAEQEQQEQERKLGSRQRKISISASALDTLTLEEISDESDESSSVKSTSPSFKKGFMNIFRWRKSTDKEDQ